MKIKLYMHNVIVYLVIIVFCTVAMYLNVFNNLDNRLGDILYRQSIAPNPNVIILGIDNKALYNFGSTEKETLRQKTAEAIEILNGNPDTMPKTIGIDILFSGYSNDKKADTNLVQQTKKYNNIIYLSDIVIRKSFKVRDGQSSVSKTVTEEKPFAELEAVCEYGYADLQIGSDGFVREAVLYIKEGDQCYSSFAKRILEKYDQSLNLSDRLLISYSKNRSYFYASLWDLLNGSLDLSQLKDKIVLIGSYSTSFDDKFFTRVSNSMFSIEVHANILGTVLSDEINRYISFYASIILLLVLSTAYILVLHRYAENTKNVLLFTVSFCLLYVLALRIVKIGFGYLCPIIYQIIVFICISAYFIYCHTRQNPNRATNR